MLTPEAQRSQGGWSPLIEEGTPKSSAGRIHRSLRTERSTTPPSVRYPPPIPPIEGLCYSPIGTFFRLCMLSGICIGTIGTAVWFLNELITPPLPPSTNE